jgi:plastocyanin
VLAGHRDLRGNLRQRRWRPASQGLASADAHWISLGLQFAFKPDGLKGVDMAARSVGRRLLIVGCVFFLAAAAQAAEIRVRVDDGAGASVADAVLSLNRVGGTPAMSKKASATMDQHDLRFTPFVLPVQAGTTVTFPNSDNVRHQVYSFSASKRFQLSLYTGNHASTVLFDQPGIVALGCNIHDWMVGYVVVLDTPYFAKTAADGSASIVNLPAGEYVVHLWHPRIEGATSQVVEQRLVVAGAPLQRDFHLHLRAPDQSNMPPAGLEMGLGHRMHPHGT